jgi:hypothetical protein
MLDAPRENLMQPESSRGSGHFSLSLDTWAVLLALALALSVRFGLFTKVPW